MMSRTKGRRNAARRVLAVVLAAGLALSTAACGKGSGAATDASDSSAAGGGQDSVQQYAAKVLDIEMDESAFYNMKQVGDNLYYTTGSYDEETGTGNYHIYRYAVLEEQAEELPMTFGSSPQLFDVGTDGSIYAVVGHFVEGKGISRNLEKYDASGEMLYRTEITEWTDTQNADGGGYLVALSSDAEGRSYVACQKYVFFFDEQGAFTGSADLAEGDVGEFGDGIRTLCRGKDGRVCAVVAKQNGNGALLTEIDFSKRTSKTVWEEFPGFSAVLGIGAEKDFLVSDGSLVYEYDLTEQSAEPVLSWADCGVIGNQICFLGAVSNGNILAVTSDYAAGTRDIQLLSRLSAEDLAEREEIVLGDIYPVTVMEKAVADFNKSSLKYHITLKKYMEGDWSTEAIEEARTRLNMDIISGNGPDIISLSNVNLDGMVEQGILEDLSPWLDKSTLIGREDFLDKALELGYCQGTLIGLPKRFTMVTVAGRAADLGKKPGWTLEEFMAYADAHPDKQLFSFRNNQYILSFGLTFTLDSFVDSETGKCSFDSPEFIELLKFADRCSKRGEDSEDFLEERVQKGEILLLERDVFQIVEMQYFKEIFRGDVCMVGYPTSDGSAAAVLYPNAMCGIAANSQHKEGAWAFLESFVSGPNDPFVMNSYPAMKNRMEELIQDTMAQEGNPVLQKDSNGKLILDEDGRPLPEYKKDENGDPVLDENGNPVPLKVLMEYTYGGSSSVPGVGFKITYYAVTDEEVEQFMEVIRNARPYDYEMEKVRSIIREEAAFFFDGQKSAEQVADVIQNRVQLYLNENR